MALSIDCYRAASLWRVMEKSLPEERAGASCFPAISDIIARAVINDHHNGFCGVI